MRRTITSTQPYAIAAIVALLVAFLGARHTVHASDQGTSLGRFARLKVFGLTDDGHLVRFRAGSPRKTSDIGYVYGSTGKRYSAHRYRLPRTGQEALRRRERRGGLHDRYDDGPGDVRERA